MNIQELSEKCKSPELYVASLIVLVGIGSFLLGRISVMAPEGTAVLTDNNEAIAALDALHVGAVQEGGVSKGEAGLVVASKGSSVYHFPWCAGAAHISEKNKVWFKTIADAKAQGLKPASNCKGLE